MALKSKTRDKVIRNLEAIRRSFLASQVWLNHPGNTRLVPQVIHDRLIRQLEDAQDEYRKISKDSAATFTDLADVMTVDDDWRPSRVAAYQAEGVRRFDNALTRLATRY